MKATIFVCFIVLIALCLVNAQSEDLETAEARHGN